MRLKSAYILIIFIILVAGCAKEPRMRVGEKVTKVGEDPTAALYVDFIRSELERYQEAPVVSIESIDSAIVSDPSIGFFYYQRAAINADQGEWQKVEIDCREALAKDPKLLDAKILLAKSLGVQKKHDEAIKYLEEIKRIQPDREEVYTLLAKEYMNIERYRDAERIMRTLLVRDSEAMVAYYYLGAIYGAYLKQPLKAIDIYNKILFREPENAQVIDAMSQLYLDIGKPKEALEMLVELEKHRPHDIALKLKIAQLHYKLKNYPEAIKRFETILAANPGSDKIIYYLGVLYEEAGQTTKAVIMYRDVPPVSGLYKDARLRLAFRLKELGDPEASEEVLIEGIKRQPKVMEFYQYLGGIYERDGNMDGAIKIIQKATKVFPDDERLYFALGTLYEKKGDLDKAVGAMYKVLEFDPKNAGALNYIGYTLVEQGKDIDKAEAMLQEAMLLKPNDGYILDSLGWLYFTKGDITKAFNMVSKAVLLAPNEPTIQKHMGEIYLKRGEPARALRYFKKALSLWQRKESINQKELEETISLVEQARSELN